MHTRQIGLHAKHTMAEHAECRAEEEPEEELDDSNDRIIGLRLPNGLNVDPCHLP